jgi:hypothetical protein
MKLNFIQVPACLPLSLFVVITMLSLRIPSHSFLQPDSDAEDILEKLKSSTRWSGLKDNSELRRCLEVNLSHVFHTNKLLKFPFNIASFFFSQSHMSFLKEYEKSRMGMDSSISEVEKRQSSLNVDIDLLLCIMIYYQRQC